MKKILLILSSLLLLSFSAAAADFPDMPDDWSTAALNAAVENGLLSGSDGYPRTDRHAGTHPGHHAGTDAGRNPFRHGG